MRVPLKWLGEFVEIAPETTPEDVLASLVSVGFEEEDTHSFELRGPIVVGQVLSFEPEPQSNGKTIRWCQVDVGASADSETGRDVRGIVCGASNFAVGDKVVATLPGAVLPGPFPIAARKTYGHVSDGMMASAKELGLGDEHNGIIVLSELGLDPEVGTDAIALLGLDEDAVEINVTPDRGYALSLRGVAREYSHATGAAFTDPVSLELAPQDVPLPGGFEVSVDDASPIRGNIGCTEFVARIVRGVDPSRPTPPFMVARLTLAGVRSLGILIDITNYVMLELGNPVHGYDLDKLTGGIVVRRASEGEQLETLDGKVRDLHPEDLLITDGSGPIGLAGVMGGLSTEMTETTRNVLIEAARFDPTSIARTARRHKLSSEASRRFERAVDPLLQFAAANRVADLMVEYAGGELDPAGAAIFAEVEIAAIELPGGFVSGLIGVDYTDDQVRHALETIGCEVVATQSGFEVIPPSWRPDLNTKWDLTEEVARINGYDQIPSVLPKPPSSRGFTPAQRGRRRVSDALAAAGFVETPSFGFVTAEQNALFGSADGAPVASVKLANPLAGQAPLLRTALLPGLMEVAHRNIARGLTDVALFETGVVFQPEPGVEYGTSYVPPLGERPSDATLAELNASIPPQPRHVAVLLAGNRVAKQPDSAAAAFDLSDALDAVRAIANAAGVTIDVVQGSHQALHPGRTGVLSIDGVAVGVVGELHPTVSAEADLPGRVYVAELDLDAVLASAGQRITAESLSSYPAATQDVSLVVDAKVTAGEVADALRAGAGELLESLRLVDDYRGQGVPEGQKSLTYALRFRAEDRTLTQAEATDAKLAGVAEAATRLNAALRD